MKLTLLFMLAIFSNITASILMKKVSVKISESLEFRFIMEMFSQYELWAGVFFYFLSLVFYVLILSRVNLNMAHPIITSSAIVGVLLGSVIILGEGISFNLLVGIGLVILGIIFIYAGGISES